MGMFRRADIVDRGRRWIPNNGKYGTVTMTFNQASVTIGVNFKETPTPTATWEVTDWDGGKTTVNGNNPTISFNTANGGTIYCVLPGTVNTLTAVGQSCNYVSFQKGNKYSDLITCCFYSNELVSMPGYAWPSLEQYRLYSNPSLQTIQTQEWPSLTDFLVYSSGNLEDFVTQDWPNLETFNCRDCDSIVNIDGDHEWPNLIRFDSGYSANIETITTNSGWVSCNYIDIRYGKVASFETHPEWVSLEQLQVGGNDLTSLNTYNSWTNLKLLDINKNYGIQSLTIHPSWSNFEYLDMRSEPMSANMVDSILIAIEALGNSDGYIDYRLQPTAADSNRSATANTAIAALEGRDWTIRR